jgi:hypothetical protein
MTKRKAFIISHKYNGKDTTDNPYIYPKLESKDDIFKYINGVVLPSENDMKVIEFFKERNYVACCIADINLAMGLEAKKPSTSFDKYYEGKKPACPYGQIKYTIKKLKIAGLIQSENIGRFSTMLFNRDLWTEFNIWLINRGRSNF